MFIELHMIQSFAPSNLNRDDANNPKDCEFGGARRARISSQCIKRAIRLEPAFTQATAVEPAIRSRWITRRLSQALVDAGKPPAEVNTVVRAFAEAYAGKIDPDSGRTSVMLYLSAGEVATIVATLLEDWGAAVAAAGEKEPFKDLVKQIIKETQNRTSGPDIALFGRMLADKPELNLDAACQVAHAISTHRVAMEMDFFTAVDDLHEAAEGGAGMLGFTGFNSACFYRYARVDWRQLVRNLDGDVDLARRTVEGFLRASIRAIPSGKQNSFAAYNPPSFTLAVVRDDGMSWSLANAFERPVRPQRDSGLVAPSVRALEAYWSGLCDTFGAESLVRVAALALDPDAQLQTLADARVPNQDRLVYAVLEALPTAEAEA